jgi:hypothetical protein
MKRTLLIAPAALLALFATPALADRGRSEAAASEAAAQTADATPDGKAKAEPKICKTFQNTASRLKAERLCLTKDEWRKFDDAQ